MSATAGDVHILRHTMAGYENECFRYDARQRLRHAYTAANGPTTDCGTGYDANARAAYLEWYLLDGRHRFQRHAERDYTYNTSVAGCANGSRSQRQHAPSAISAAGGWPAETYRYNCTGSVVERTVGADTWDYIYGPRNELLNTRKNTEPLSRNLYTASGQRVMRVDPNGTKTIYLGNQDIRYNANTGNVQVARYYTHGERRAFNGRYIHTLTNQQNTAIATMNANNGNTQQARYRPYGTLRDGTITNDHGYLDQILDPAQQLTYLNARHYNHHTGTFQTIDPILKPDQPPTLNPYTYSHANPITFSDATGLSPACARVEATAAGRCRITRTETNEAGETRQTTTTYYGVDPNDTTDNVVTPEEIDDASADAAVDEFIESAGGPNLTTLTQDTDQGVPGADLVFYEAAIDTQRGTAAERDAYWEIRNLPFDRCVNASELLCSALDICLGSASAAGRCASAGACAFGSFKACSKVVGATTALKTVHVIREDGINDDSMREMVSDMASAYATVALAGTGSALTEWAGVSYWQRLLFNSPAGAADVTCVAVDC